MGRKILSLALVGVFSMSTALAEVPTQALTFETNVKIFNADALTTEKIQKAEEFIKRVVATDEFRNQILNYTYNGVKAFVDNGGLSNVEIYQKILDGAERLNGIKNNSMDIEIEMYYENTSTVGYTYSGTPRIYANRKFYDGYSAATITGNMTHEWLHKLGFTHSTYFSESRNHSVPYAIGTIMRTIAAQLPGEIIAPTPSPAPMPASTAPTNLRISNTASNLVLTWTAASASNGISEYRIYRRLSGSTTSYLQGSTTGTSFTQSLPTSNAIYYVKAVDKSGASVKSAEVSFMKLTAVSNLSLTTSTSSVSLKWSPAQSSAGLKEYRVYRRLYGSYTNYLQGTTTSLSFSQPKPSSEAYYYVRAVDVNGLTIKSNEVMFSR